MLTEEERAAIKVQSLIRGRSGRADYALVRDEEACRQWITYYVALGEYEDAEELGWDGVDPPPPTEEELEANIAAMEMDEGLKADAPSETPQQGARPSRGEQLYEEATRSSSSSKEAEKATVLSPRWLAQIAQSAAGAVVDAGGGLLAAAGSPFGSSSKQIRAAIVVQTWARVVLARAAVRAERRAQAEAELELGQLERQASIIQGAWSHKKAGQRSGVDIEQRAAVLVQSWARVLLAKIAAYHQERQVRLLAFFTHIEDKQASAIQRAYRAARAIRIAGEEAPRSSALGGGVGGGVGAGIVPVLGAQAEGGMAYTGGMTAVLSSSALQQGWQGQQGQQGSPSGRHALAPSAVGNQLDDATGKPRFGKPATGLQLTIELQTMVDEIALRRGATIMRRVSRQAIKHDLHSSLKGVLWKRNHNMPRFQRRAVYVTPMYADGPPALCYVGPPPNNFEKQIPLASISSVMFESERRLEFSIDATSRKHKLVLRADDEKECFLWIDGISLLLSLSDYADYVPL